MLYLQGTAELRPHDEQLSMTVDVHDISLHDMQAAPEHAVVLRPHGTADRCSVYVEYSKMQDESVRPSLVVEVENPGFMLLFRFGRRVARLQPVCIYMHEASTLTDH